MARRRKKSQLPSAVPRDDLKGDKRPQLDQGAPAHSAQQAARALLSRFGSIAGAIPALAALLASLNSLANGFVYDDVDQILNNRSIKSLSNLPMMFTTSVWAFINNQNIGANDFYYRPVFGCFLTLGYALSGTTAWGWHLISIAIHAAVAFFVYLVIKEISNRDRLALISATLFAVHPVHAESVAWISGAPDPLMALFVLPAFYFYVRYRRTGRPLKLVLSVLLYFPAMFSKETAVVFPVVLLSWELILSDDRTRLWQRVKAMSWRLAPFCLPVAAYLAMRLYVFGMLAPATARLSMSDGLRTIPKALLTYLRLSVFPAGYNIQHVTAPAESVLALDFIVPMLLLMVVIVLVLLARSRLLFYAAIWFVVWLGPVLAALRMFFSVHAVLERYLYLPSIGICLAAGLAIEWIASRDMFARRKLILEAGLSSVLLVVLLAVSVQQNAVWKDNLSLYRHAVDVSPESPLAHTALSTQYAVIGRRDESERQARIASDLDPHCMDAYLNLAYLAREKGDNKAAIGYLERAKTMVREGPLKRAELATICANLANLYDQLKQYDLAEQNFVEATVLLPSSNRIWEELGDFYYERGQWAQALEIFRKVSQGVARGYAPIYVKLGHTYERLDDPADARIEYQDYLRFAPAADDAEEVRRRLSRL